MALLDRCMFTATSSGTGDFVVSAAATGFMTPATAGAADGVTYSYYAQSDDLTQWEVGQGVYTVSSTTLARTTVLFSSAGGGAKTSFSVAPKVAIDCLVEDLFPNAPAVNLFMNPAMEVDQEFVGAAKTSVGGTSLVYAIDGVQVRMSGTATARFTTQQVSDGPAGFLKSVKYSVTTAQASFTSAQAVGINFPIEGYMLARLGFGAAGASPISIGFWVKANRTGQYGGSFGNGSANRSYPFSFTIASSGVWQYVTVTIPGDTTGTWTIDNTAQGNLVICLAAGSSMVGTANTWAASNLYSATGQINGVAATTDFMNITGITCFRGNVPCSQERLPYIMPRFDDVLKTCQRYYEKSYNYETALGAVTTVGRYFWSCPSLTSASQGPDFTTLFKVTKRTNPTFTTYSTAGASGKVRDVQNGSDVTPVIANQGESNSGTSPTGSAASTTWSFAWHWVADARM